VLRWRRLKKHATSQQHSLITRRALEQWMSAALSRADAGHPGTLLTIDVDHFKQVNEKLSFTRSTRKTRAIIFDDSQCSQVLTARSLN